MGVCVGEWVSEREYECVCVGEWVSLCSVNGREYVSEREYECVCVWVSG